MGGNVLIIVLPAKAGIQPLKEKGWTPAFAGVTKRKFSATAPPLLLLSPCGAVRLLAVEAERLQGRRVGDREQDRLVSGAEVFVGVPAPVRHHEAVARPPRERLAIDDGAALAAHDEIDRTRGVTMA